MHLPFRPTFAHAGAALCPIGLTTLGIGITTDERGPTSLGIIAIVMAVQMFQCHHSTRIIRATHGPSRVMFDKGKEMGYQQGWRDGHRAARPVVVPMRPTDDELAKDFCSS